jgi:hypothetical protein
MDRMIAGRGEQPTPQPVMVAYRDRLDELADRLEKANAYLSSMADRLVGGEPKGEGNAPKNAGPASVPNGALEQFDHVLQRLERLMTQHQNTLGRFDNVV